MKPHLYRFLLPVSLLSVASPLACALSIGDIVLSSYLNEPLKAQIDIQLNDGEAIDDSCITLAAADGSALSRLGNLPINTIRLQYQASQHVIELTSSQEFRDPYAIFQLKINCLQYGNVLKTFTVLPEFNPQPQASSAEQNQPPIVVMPIETSSVVLSTTTLETLPVAPKTQPLSHPKKPRAVPYLPVARSLKKFKLPPFGLKLSSEPLDLTRFPSLNQETRDWLAAQKGLLNETVPGSYLLTLSQDLARTKHALENAKLQLSAQALTAPKSPTGPATEGFLNTTLAFLQQWKMLLIAIAMSLTAWLIYRATQNYRATGIHLTSSTQKNNAATTAALNKNSDLAASEMSVQEEAELYTIYGHPDKGIKILREFLTVQPNSGKIWLRLLSIYASQGLTHEFEFAAKEFSRTNKNSEAWKMAQALGRTLDTHNPLYFDNITRSNIATDLEEKQIGNILVDLGHLTPENLVQAEKEFNAKKHGRFGHFLVVKQFISHEQLDLAVFKQQSIFRPQKVAALAELPSLDLDLDLPPINASEGDHTAKHELFEFDWDFTKSKTKV